MNDLVDKIVMRTLFCVIILLGIGLPFSIYQEVVAEKFDLRKDQWTCTESHREIRGAKAVYTVEVCDNWRRAGA